MNAPLEKETPTQRQAAVFILRPDLTLQISCGDAAPLEVQLSADKALGLALAVLAKVAEAKPWGKREDAQVINSTLALGFLATRLARIELNMPGAISTESQRFIGAVLNPAAAVIESIEEGLTRLEQRGHDHRNQTH